MKILIGLSYERFNRFLQNHWIIIDGPPTIAYSEKHGKYIKKYSKKYNKR